MAFKLTTSTIIRRSVEDVFHFHADIRNHADWHDHIITVEPLNDLPIGIGAKFRVTNKVGVITAVDTREIVAYEPPYTYTYTVRRNGFIGTSQQICEAVPEGTRWTVIGDFKTMGMMRLVEPMMKRRLGEHFHGAVEELKVYLERH